MSAWCWACRDARFSPSRMTMPDRGALVIGGRRGIGAAVVQALAGQGMDVTYTYRTAPR